MKKIEPLKNGYRRHLPNKQKESTRKPPKE